MKKIKNILILFLASIIYVSCDVNNELDEIVEPEVVYPEATSGSADFSNYVAIGPSFTAGITDNGLFIAAQENSFPNILSKKFANAGGGDFIQPMMSDNNGGFVLNGSPIINPNTGLREFTERLVLDPETNLPAPLLSISPMSMATTEIGDNPTGPFNNLGVPGAQSADFIRPGYGNIANFASGTANPYAIRMTGNTPDATILELAVDQNPTFFTADLIGGNDVLGYATQGGDADRSAITPPATFATNFNTIIDGLTANGAKGAVTNIPYVSNLPYFNAVPYNSLSPENPAFGPLIPTLNGIFGQINLVFEALGKSERSIVFSDSENSPVIIKDETLDNIASQMTAAFNASPTFPLFVQSLGLPASAAPLVANLLGSAYGQCRQANAEDLMTLPSAGVIGTLNSDFFDFLVSQGIPAELAGQFSAEGITYPLDDRWVLLPSEDAEIISAVDAYNGTIQSVASSKGLAFVDVNQILIDAAALPQDGGGITFDDYTLNANLVLGGLVSLDGIHLTARGYAYMANSFLKAIDETYGSNFEASGNLAKAGEYPTNYSPTLQTP